MASSYPTGTAEAPIPPARAAESKEQWASIAEKSKNARYSLYETVTEENLENYHKISCRPITKRAEDDMELVSDVVSWGERYLHHWKKGTYKCSRCLIPLYGSTDKYKGPCVWPSFRKSIEEESIAKSRVSPYNKYEVAVDEIYCGNCHLFIGHRFEDAGSKGDTHPDAHWRH